MVFKMSPLPCSSFLQNFKKLKFFEWFGFSSNSSNEHVLSYKGTCFCCTKKVKSIIWFYAFFFKNVL
jgi:hypothetical protein